MMMMMAHGDETMSGWRFDPFDHELIADYLKPKITNKHFSCNLVKNKQVYGPASNPWQIFDPKDECWLKTPHIKPSQKFMFVFTQLSKLSSSGASKNTSKKAGCGTWVGKTSRKKIRDDGGNLIGESRYLVFEINETHSAAVGVGVDLSKVGSYTMHEYRLSGINEALNSGDTVVVCKITHDSSKTPTLALKSGANIADCVSGDAQIEEECNNNLGGTGCLTTENLTGIDGAVCDNLDEARTLTSEQLIAMDSGAGVDNLKVSRSLTSESMVMINGDVAKSGDKTADCVSGSTSEARLKEDSDNNLGGTGSLTTAIDGAVCDNLDERTPTSQNLIAMDGGTLTSENLVVINSDVAEWYAPLYNNDLPDWDACGGGYGLDDLPSGDFCLDDLGDNVEESGTLTSESLAVINSDVAEWYAPTQCNNGLKSGAKIADRVSGYTSEAQFKEDSDNNLGVTGSLTAEIDVAVCDNLDERTTTSQNLIAMDSGTLTSDSLAVINSDVGEWFAPLCNNDLPEWDACDGCYGLDDLPSGDFCLDDLGGYETDWIMDILDFDHEEELVENSKLGKRKFEDNENSCQTKKICLQ